MKFSSYVLTLALVAVASFQHSTAEQPPIPASSGGGFTDDPQEIKEIERQVDQQQRSMRQITIREANLIHKWFIERCMDELPRAVTVQYVGLLGTDDGRLKTRVVTDDVGGSLGWHVQADLVMFGFWISTMPTKDTVAKCSVETKDIFVNVSFVDGNRGIDAKLQELGGHSVKDILLRIEKGNAKTKPPAQDVRPKREARTKNST